MKYTRQKCFHIKNEQLCHFVKCGNVSRTSFLDSQGFTLTEQDDIIGLGFFIRDGLQKFISLDETITQNPDAERQVGRSLPYVLEAYEIFLPNCASIGSKLHKIEDLLQKDDSRLYLAIAIYFLKHYSGSITQKNVYVY